MSIRGPITAGLAYGLIGFALGLVFGVVRTLFVAPAIGAFAAVAVETALLLAACLPLASWCLHNWQSARPAYALVAGVVGFAALMACEVMLGLALGQTLQDILAGMARPPGMLGLAGQIVFALLPAGLAVSRK
ncbi:hypothetical protein [Novosphingobium sp. AAP93]|uniref:hypothetical protein n=1 Tax=Novosphingobium sp. AAP93 TaxID=1523427 RepID=UPI0012E2321B|nr:hypothetical protein [Novosphingobium sp. AAP93]